MIKKTLLAASLAVAISGCSITPNIVSSDQLVVTAAEDMELLSRDQAVEGAVTLNEAIARAVLNNREKKLKALEAALAQGQIELVQHDSFSRLFEEQ